jgi:hypothetical protein
MVSAAWVAGKINPYASYVKALAIAAASASLLAAGWTANGWRLGERMARLELAVERKQVARQTALTERQQKAQQAALEAVRQAQGRLVAERRANAKAVQKAAEAAPEATAPAGTCVDRREPLPEKYLEEFRQ